MTYIAVKWVNYILSEQSVFPMVRVYIYKTLIFFPSNNLFYIHALNIDEGIVQFIAMWHFLVLFGFVVNPQMIMLDHVLETYFGGICVQRGCDDW